VYPGRISVKARQGKMGLGTAYLIGFNQALKESAQAFAQMNADLSQPPKMLLVLLIALQYYDVAVGSRYIP